MPTLVCVPIAVRDIEVALRDAFAAQELGAEIVEFRVDGFESATLLDDIAALVSRSCLPCILTCRSSREGGAHAGDDEERLAVIRRCCADAKPGEHPPRYLDFELASLADIGGESALAQVCPDSGATGTIISMHDFEGRPADFSRRVRGMRESRAEVLKVAIRARSIRDNLELFELLAERDRPTIALGIGEFGLMSRVLAPKFGGFLTFASLRRQSATAPGQPTVDELLNLYRFRTVNKRTRVYGVVGYPLGHSMSPLVHNAGFAALGHDAVYLPLPIPGEPQVEGSYENLKGTLLELIEHPQLDFTGCSVTLPHKEHLFRLATEQGWSIDPTARTVGAANTLRVTRDAGGRKLRVEITNTDGSAAMAALADTVGGVDRLRGRSVGVVGAGGAARSIAHGALACGCKVTVFNRSAESAERLSDELNGQRREPASARPLNSLATSRCDVYVNCTPLGMKGGPEPETIAIPVREIDALLPPGEERPVVLDTVYNPMLTPLLAAAKELRWRAIDGVQMFVRQAETQFQYWVGSAPPDRLFDSLVRARLAESEASSPDQNPA